MGMRLFGSSSSYEPCKQTPPLVQPTLTRRIPFKPKDKNPDPMNYRIIRYEEIGLSLVIELQYPDCDNYEGRKILVYKELDFLTLINQRSIDPHFCNHATMRSPFARFEPTEEGWSVAKEMAKHI